jgi:hypothetical protein
MKKLFKTKRLDSTATAVITDRFQENGERLKVMQYGAGKPRKVQCTSILTIFGGSDGGKSEAERLCRYLNGAYEAFHKRTDGQEWEVLMNLLYKGKGLEASLDKLQK